MKNKLLSLLGTAVIALSAVNIQSCGPSKEKQIVFWHCIGHEKARNLQRIVDKFNEDHKETDGYQVVLEQIAGEYTALHDRAKTKLKAGYVPSITMGYPDSFAEYIGNDGSSNSRILNLNQFIDKDKDFKQSDFVDQYFAEGQGYHYEGTWSVPLYKSTEAMYVNKELFEGTSIYKEHKDETYGQYGAKIGDPNTWDWDTLIYVATEIAKEKAPSKGADFRALGYDSDSNLFISQMAMRNIPYTSATGKGEDHFQFVKDGVINEDLLNFACDMYDLAGKQVIGTQGTVGGYSSDLFMQKKCVFSIGSTGGSAYQDPTGSTQGGFTCSLYKVPTVGPKENAKYIMQGPSLCLFNTRNTEKEKATWEFYSKYIADPELNTALALENSYDPIKKSCFESESYTNWTEVCYNADGSIDEHQKLARRIPLLTKDLKDNYITSPVFNGSAEARTQIGQILKYALSETGTTREKCTKAIKKAYDGCLNFIRGVNEK